MSAFSLMIPVTATSSPVCVTIRGHTDVSFYTAGSGDEIGVTVPRITAYTLVVKQQLEGYEISFSRICGAASGGAVPGALLSPGPGAEGHREDARHLGGHRL